jgi:Txe/YoeB family toxin of toxin-antitoxin system
MICLHLPKSSVDVSTSAELREHAIDLIEVQESTSDADVAYKEVGIWEVPSVLDLLSEYSQENQVILRFLESIPESEFSIDNLGSLVSAYPEFYCGFWGILFGPKFEKSRCVRNIGEYQIFLSQALKSIPLISKEIAEKVLVRMYPNYEFSKEAIEDALHWYTRDQDTYRRMHDLLEDIVAHPYSLGLGKTEKLKGNLHASKRLTDVDRVSYIFGKTIQITRCRGHYKGL